MEKNGINFNLEVNEIKASIENNQRKNDNHILLFMKHVLCNDLKQLGNKIRVESFRPTKIFPIIISYEINT